MKLTFNFVVDTTTGEIEVTNTETGEIKSVKFEKKKVSKTKNKSEENNKPQLTLENNKYKFNSAAVELMNLEPDDRIDIKYEKYNGTMKPIIGKDEAFQTSNGNRLTKSFTVSCRGKANNELSQYGNVFDIKPCSDKQGIYFLLGDKDEIPADNDIELPSDEEEIDLTDEDMDFADLIDDNDEITASDFSF